MNDKSINENIDLKAIGAWFASAKASDTYTFDFNQVNTLFHALNSIAITFGSLQVMMMRMALNSSDKEFAKDVASFQEKAANSSREIFGFVNGSAKKWAETMPADVQSDD